MSRLIRHLFQQHSYELRKKRFIDSVCFFCYRFYPLMPPHESVSVEYEQAIEHAKINSLPHLFITSSDLRPFIKVGKEKFQQIFFFSTKFLIVY